LRQYQDERLDHLEQPVWHREGNNARSCMLRQQAGDLHGEERMAARRTLVTNDHASRTTVRAGP
jgi:hypothetical protein